MEAAPTPVTPAVAGEGTQHVPGIDSLGAVRLLVAIALRAFGQPAPPTWAPDAVIAHSADGAGRLSDRPGHQERQRHPNAEGSIEHPPGATRTIGARVLTARAPVLDGRSERAIIGPYRAPRSAGCNGPLGLDG